MSQALRKIVESDGVCLVTGKYNRQYEMLCPHHIIPKGRGGSDDPSNIITVCHEAHRAIHDGQIDMLEILKKYRKTKFWRWEAAYQWLENNKERKHA